MPEKTVPAREPSSISMLAGWLRQGTESFFASQRILTDLVMRQNAHTIGAFQGRLTEARNIAGAAVTEMAGEGISNFIAAQRVLLNLAQRQNELLTTVVKERIDGSGAGCRRDRSVQPRSRYGHRHAPALADHGGAADR